jgi:hypothetical protein
MNSSPFCSIEKAKPQDREKIIPHFLLSSRSSKSITEFAIALAGDMLLIVKAERLIISIEAEIIMQNASKVGRAEKRIRL